MTLAIARKTLNLAQAELAHARNYEQVRQAAEKGWRAAREAVYAVLREAGMKIRGTLNPDNVRAFEGQYFGLTRGGPLTNGYMAALQMLHGDCFYDGVIFPTERIVAALSNVEYLIEVSGDAIDTIQSTSKSHRGRGRGRS